jgi:hypothetical protein
MVPKPLRDEIWAAIGNYRRRSALGQRKTQEHKRLVLAHEMATAAVLGKESQRAAARGKGQSMLSL